MENYVVNELAKTISQFQQQALAELVKQIIIALRGQKYEFHEILAAIAQYTKERDDWAEATTHIEAARIVVVEARARLCGAQKQDDDFE